MGYDLAIIGSGGGAFAAAIAARRRDLSVVMIERGTVGGACVNTGCVPSKALLAAAQARHVALEHRFPGIATSAGPVDWPALAAAKDGLVEAMRAGKYVDLAAEYGWPILAGAARFAGTADVPVLEVDLADGGSTRIEAAQYVVATGSAPWAPPIDGLADAGYLTSTTAMDLDRLPTSMIVIGGNAVGLEQGQLFARLGVQVTVVEALDRLAPFEEREISEVIEAVFADEGIAVHTAATVTAVRRDPSGYRVSLTAGGDQQRLRAERLLVATGRRPVTDGLHLDRVGVKTGDRGEIVVDAGLGTSNPRIWAAGDVTGHPQFVYVAAAHRCDCRVLPLEYVPRAVVNRDTRGLVKLVADADTSRLLGAHVIAEGAGEVIAAAVYALANHMTVAQMADLWCPYLTMAEALKLAAQTYTRDVSKLSCCAA